MAGTHAVFPFLTHQDFIIHAAFAARPKRFVLCEFRISYGFIPSSELIFITANPVVSPKILASGYFSRLSSKIFFLMALASPPLRKLGDTMRPELAT
jgi:hypothetical protein